MGSPDDADIPDVDQRNGQVHPGTLQEERIGLYGDELAGDLTSIEPGDDEVGSPPLFGREVGRENEERDNES